jgi:hypothetical protein
MALDKGDEGLEWQIGVWDQISDLYLREIDRRFVGDGYHMSPVPISGNENSRAGLWIPDFLA